MINTTENQLNIMFDLHGVIGDYPETFKPLMQLLKTSGHKIFICSGPDSKTIKMELDFLDYQENIHYDEIISIYEYLLSLGVTFEFDERNRPWTNETIWWRSKSEICKTYNIKIMIDDHEEYSKTLSPETTFVLFKGL